MGDVCDLTPNGDDDNDTVDNLADNCPAVANVDQLNGDGDSAGLHYHHHHLTDQH